jgi:hypothetical protein
MPKPRSSEEKQVEKRQTDDRYVVMLPLKPTVSQLGDSKQSGLHRFYSLVCRFAKDLAINAANSAFIDEDEKLYHMSPTISPIASSSKP